MHAKKQTNKQTLTRWDFFDALGDVALVEEALGLEFGLGFTIDGFVEGLAAAASLIIVAVAVFAQFVSLFLLYYPVEQPSLVELVRVFVFDHVLVFARLAEHRKNVYFIEFLLIWHRG